MNIYLIEKVKDRIRFEIKELFGVDLAGKEILIQETRKEFIGDLTFVVFPVTKYSKLGPEQTATILGEKLENSELIQGFQVVKGFLNLSIKENILLEEFYKAYINEKYGQLDSISEKVLVEFSSPNTNKPLHLGHIRNNLLGYSICEILKASGREVIRTCLVNDRGIHICKSMVAYQIWGHGESPESSGIKGDHLVGKYYVRFETELKKEIEKPLKNGIEEELARNEAPLMIRAKKMLLNWENKDPDVLHLWRTMNNWVYSGFNQTYKNLGIEFDKFYYESDTYLLGKDLIDEGLKKGVFFQKPDSSVWIDLTEDGLDQKLVLRSDGTSVYITQDLGTAQLKYKDFKMDRSIHVVGNEQDYHFKVLFLILKKLGKSWADGLFHLSYGMVDLPSGKMKSREGTVVDADDLMDQMVLSAGEQTEALGKSQDLSPEDKIKLYRIIGFGALKYFLLKVDPQKRLLFDPKESIDLQGNTGPFIQYSYARIRSILRKLEPITGYKMIQTFNSNEKELIKHILQFDLNVFEASNQLSPALIATYLYELAKKFNQFYHEFPVLKEPDLEILNFRLQLCELVSRVIQRGMSYLGIEVPEKM